MPTFFRNALTAWLVMLLFISTAHARTRAPRMLDIRVEGDHVMACIPADEGDTVAVDAAGVTAIGSGHYEASDNIWGIELEPGQTPVVLGPGQCLAFAQRPDGYRTYVEPTALKEGMPYSFSLRSPELGRHRTRNHSGDFCLRKSSSGLQARNIPHSHQAITAETCRRLFEQPS